jgi:hypothetical protein
MKGQIMYPDGSGKASRRMLLAGLGLVLAAQPAAAIKITAGKATDTASVAKCTAKKPVAKFKDCTSNAHVDKVTSLKGDNAEYAKAFKAWNDGLPADKKWTLKDGGALPDSTLTIKDGGFAATASATVGGASLRVFWDYAGADKTDYVWSTGLFDNYLLDDTIKDKPFYEIDNSGRTDNPIGSFQYDDRHYFDGPDAPWPNASFEAYSFLSKADKTNRILTIYEGIQWGFILNATPAGAPEPEAWMMLIAGFGFVGVAMRRRYAHA